MDGAIIGISAGGARGDGKFLVCVQRPRFRKLFLDADNRVRFLVPVYPGDLLSGSHGDDLRIEVEILNHDLVRSGTVCCSFLLDLAESKDAQGYEADSEQDSNGFVSDDICVHWLRSSS